MGVKVKLTTTKKGTNVIENLILVQNFLLTDSSTT
jgi:hypothetical protein